MDSMGNSPTLYTLNGITLNLQKLWCNTFVFKWQICEDCASLKWSKCCNFLLDITFMPFRCVNKCPPTGITKSIKLKEFPWIALGQWIDKKFNFVCYDREFGWWKLWRFCIYYCLTLGQWIGKYKTTFHA